MIKCIRLKTSGGARRLINVNITAAGGGWARRRQTPTTAVTCHALSGPHNSIKTYNRTGPHQIRRGSPRRRDGARYGRLTRVTRSRYTAACSRSSTNIICIIVIVVVVVASSRNRYAFVHNVIYHPDCGRLFQSNRFFCTLFFDDNIVFPYYNKLAVDRY